MLQSIWAEGPERSPITFLAFSFTAWKSLLLIIASLSPGPGYDTSTTIRARHAFRESMSADTVMSLRARIVQNLSRWDALFFTSIARRGYLYEQEWAFGAGFTKTLAYICSSMSHLTFMKRSSIHQPFRTTDISEASQLPTVTDQAPEWAGIVVAHVSHFVSAIVLYRLCLLLSDSTTPSRRALAVATLHILAPAGLFLSAPYAESPFSLLSFTGFWLYLFGLKARRPLNDFCLALSGISFGIASTFRGNGIFNGALYMFEFLVTIPSLDRSNLRYCAAILLGGGFMATIFTLPQISAWFEYCFLDKGVSRRPWCSDMPPSIYAFVQAHYW